MSLNRRQFLLMSTAAALAATEEFALADGGEGRWIDVGPASNFAADGVYDSFRDAGFFVVNRGGKILALSSWCTHRHCKLKAEPDRTFYCKCHGGTYAPNGHVTSGPPKRDLPVLATLVNNAGHLVVQVPA